MFARVIPAIMMWQLLQMATPVAALEAIDSLGIRFGPGLSFGLESGANSLSGLALHAAFVNPIRRGICPGVGFTHLEDGVENSQSLKTEYKTTTFSGLLVWRVGGGHTRGYVRSGLGVAYLQQEVVRLAPGMPVHLFWEDRAYFALSGEFGTGVELALSNRFHSYLELGLVQAWGPRSHTSGTVLLGVAGGL